MNKLSVITKIRRGLKKRLQGRSGQSTTEYILILAIVVMLASKMKGSLGKLLDNKVDKIESEISSF